MPRANSTEKEGNTMEAATPATEATANGATPTTEIVNINMAEATKHTLTLNLPDALREKIKAEAAKRDVPDNAIAREILATHYGMRIMDNTKVRAVELPGLTKEQKAEVRKADQNAKRERAAALTDAILSGKLPVDVLEKYGLGHLVPKSIDQLAKEVVAKTTGAPAEVSEGAGAPAPEAAAEAPVPA